MSYLSLSFAIFVAVLMGVFYLVPKGLRRWVLLLASLSFYGLFDLRYPVFLLVTAVSTFFCARQMVRGGNRKLLLWGCVGLNGGIWFAIKELPWLMHTDFRGLHVLGVNLEEPVFSLLVPVGISYYTLQAIGYLVDVSKGKTEPEKKFANYLLFLSWFPAIVQGPISRYDRLMPQLRHDRGFDYEMMRRNLLLILLGLVKKMVLADRLGFFVNYCFGNFESLEGVILYLGAVGYSVQLYADFSGCVDICRGVSGLFGVELCHNFNRPYRSGSIKEFWGRWHMSLSGWLKDYVYIPLGGNRKGTVRKYCNLLATFLVSGLWHGAGFNYFLWGAMHAGYQILGAVTEHLRGRVKNALGVEAGSASDRIYRTVITFHLVMVAWIVFRAGGLMTGLEYFRNMVSNPELHALFDGSLLGCGLSRNYLTLVAVHILGLFALERKYDCQEDALEGILSHHIGIRWIIYLVLIFDVLLFGVYGSGYDMSSFLYGGF